MTRASLVGAGADAPSPVDLYRELQRGQGYMLGMCLTPAELDEVRVMIRRQYLGVIGQASPRHLPVFEGGSIEHYHRHAHLLEHERLWPKLNRILPSEDAGRIRRMDFFTMLERYFGDIAVSDEEGVGHEEFYWRLVRPGAETDVGPLHADAWFWELGHGATPPGKERVKVWMSVYSVAAKSNLLMVPRSQLSDSVRYDGVDRDGFAKPQIMGGPAKDDALMVDAKPGDLVIFHDRVLHGGPVNRAETTRVSLEFTMFVDEALMAPWRSRSAA